MGEPHEFECRVELGEQIVERTLIPEYAVDNALALVVTHLIGETCARVNFTESTMVHEALHGGLGVDQHRPHLVNTEGRSKLGPEERDGDKNGVTNSSVQLSDYLDANLPVGNSIEATKSGPVIEGDFSHKSTVQRSVVREHRTAKGINESAQGGTALRSDVMGHVVGVDDGIAQSSNPFTDRRFAGADAARDHNSSHQTTVVTGCYIAAECAGWYVARTHVEYCQDSLNTGEMCSDI
jgi:hypothetical protein